MGRMSEQESVLSLACSLTVFSLLTIGLVLLNLLQTFALSNLFSPLVWFKSLVCSFPLAISIFLLVPMLSGKMNPMRTRLAMVAQFVSHPLQAATFCLAGMLLHYLLPILNPFLDFPTEDSSLKVFITQLKHICLCLGSENQNSRKFLQKFLFCKFFWFDLIYFSYS